MDDSGGAVVTGDQVGLSGLQKRYDSQLRGTPGVQVLRATSTSGPSPEPDPPPTASVQRRHPGRDGVRVAAVAGKALRLTLNLALQRLAEEILADTKPASAIVAIRPSTGAILAAANGLGAGPVPRHRRPVPARARRSRSSRRSRCCGPG